MLPRLAPPFVAVALLLLTAATLAQAPRPAPNAAGVTTGHIHLIVPDLDFALRTWRRLGGEESRAGGSIRLGFPGAYVVLTQGKPVAPSSDTALNHVGFSVRDYPGYKATLDTMGATFVFEDDENGQLLADLPGGVRIEILADREQSARIVFHHAHVVAADGAALRDWYQKVLGAEPGERGNLPSAVFPGGRVEFMPPRGAAPRPSRGAAIDHLGFEVQDLKAFAGRLGSLGIVPASGVMAPAAIDPAATFLSDPAGTSLAMNQAALGPQ